jgi:hypothetical protein
VRYSLAFLGLAALLAFALPTGYTAGALDFLGTVLLTLLAIVWTLLALIIGVVMLPVALLLTWLTGRAPPRVVNPVQPPPPPPVLTGGELPPWFASLRGLLVWGLIVAMVAYVLVSYVRERPELTRALRELGALRRLRQLWAALRHRVSGLLGAAQAHSPAAWLRARLRRAGRPPLRFFRLGGASPREQVLYYYLSLLRRAGERGFGRRPPQTPREYAPVLETHLPDTQPEIEALTEAFVETRYSPHPVEPAQARRARAAWERVRGVLRGKAGEKEREREKERGRKEG